MGSEHPPQMLLSLEECQRHLFIRPMRWVITRSPILLDLPKSWWCSEMLAPLQQGGLPFLTLYLSLSARYIRESDLLLIPLGSRMTGELEESVMVILEREPTQRSHSLALMVSVGATCPLATPSARKLPRSSIDQSAGASLSSKKPWWVFPFSLANGGLAGSPPTSDVWVVN